MHPICRHGILNLSNAEKRHPIPPSHLGAFDLVSSVQYHDRELHQVLDLVHIQLDVRVHLQVLVVGRVYLVLDILLQVRHLELCH